MDDQTIINPIVLASLRRGVLLRRQEALRCAGAVEMHVRNARTFDELRHLLAAFIEAQRHMAQDLHQQAEDLEAQIHAAAASASRKTKG